MRHIDKGSEPRELAEHRRTPGAVFKNGFRHKGALRKALVAEQGHLCAYCMQRIHDDPKTRIEHYRPQSRYPDQQLQYQNLLAVCNGSEGTRQRHCDSSKKDRELRRLDPLDHPERHITYLNDGTIESSPRDDADIDHDLNQILNLNHGTLTRNRKGVRHRMLQTVDRQLRGEADPRDALRRALDKLRSKNKHGKYPAFCELAAHVVEKRLALL